MMKLLVVLLILASLLAIVFAEPEAAERHREPKEDKEHSHEKPGCHKDCKPSCDKPKPCCGRDGRDGRDGRNGRNGENCEPSLLPYGQAYNVVEQDFTDPTTFVAIAYSNTGLTRHTTHALSGTAIYVDKAGDYLLTTSLLPSAPAVGSLTGTCTVYVNNVARTLPQYSFGVGPGAANSLTTVVSLVPANAFVEIRCAGTFTLAAQKLGVNANLIVVGL